MGRIGLRIGLLGLNIGCKGLIVRRKGLVAGRRGLIVRLMGRKSINLLIFVKKYLNTMPFERAIIPRDIEGFNTYITLRTITLSLVRPPMP